MHLDLIIKSGVSFRNYFCVILFIWPFLSETVFHYKFIFSFYSLSDRLKWYMYVVFSLFLAMFTLNDDLAEKLSV